MSFLHLLPVADIDSSTDISCPVVSRSGHRHRREGAAPDRRSIGLSSARGRARFELARVPRNRRAAQHGCPGILQPQGYGTACGAAGVRGAREGRQLMTLVMNFAAT